MKSYFISGTDTNCGKTYISCQLLRVLRAQGVRALAIKLVASGCYITADAVLINEDLVRLDACNFSSRAYDNFKAQNLTPWRFEPPISMHLAAAYCGQTISIQALAEFCQHKIFADIEVLLIEGAGGLMAPLNYKETWLDFLKFSNIPTILVVGMRLGCLNHALLSAAALDMHAIACRGWIANCLDRDMLALADNIASLSLWLKYPLMGQVDYDAKFTDFNLDILSDDFLV